MYSKEEIIIIRYNNQLLISWLCGVIIVVIVDNSFYQAEYGGKLKLLLLNLARSYYVGS